VSDAAIVTSTNRSNVWLIVMTLAVFVGLSTYFNLATDAFLEADGVTHYLYARFAFDIPAYFTDVWARPVRVLLHAIPATYTGVHGVRAMSMVLAVACAWFAFLSARQLKLPRPELAFVFLLAQPATFFHSFQELTELPFALVVAVAFYAMTRKWWWLVAVMVAISPAARPEGFALLVLTALCLAAYRRWLELLILPTGLIVWSVAGSVLNPGSPWYRWLWDSFPYSAKSAYAAGSLFQFVALLPAVVGPVLLPMALLGAVKLLRLETGWNHRRVCLWVAVGLPACVLAGHSVLFWLGRMSSSGDIRYLVSFAPLWAMWPAMGWMMIRGTKWGANWDRGLIALACLLPLLANVWWRVIPTELQNDARGARDLAAWVKALPASEQPNNLMTTHPAVLFFFDRSIGDVRAPTIKGAWPGTWMIWEPIMSSANANPQRVIGIELMTDWRELEVPVASAKAQYRVFVKQ